MTAPRWVAAPLSVGLVLVLLLGAIGAGLRVPGLSFLTGLPGLGSLDYRTLSTGGFLPLRAGYVDELLGTDLDRRRPDLAERPAASDRLLGDEPPDEAGVLLPKQEQATADAVVDHSFTNDAMSSPLVITSLPFRGRTDTRAATRERGEPDSCAPTGGTAWYAHTSASDGTLLADTLGSDHPAAVAAFRRSAATGALTQVACGTRAEGITVPAAKGTTYLFQVTGLLGGGSLVFSLRALGRTDRVSRPATGRGPGDVALRSAISGDGRFAAYESRPNEACSLYLPCPGQVLVVDRRTGTSTVVSRSSDGLLGNGKSAIPSLSHDGRWVGFSSTSTNLVPDDGNNSVDHFVHDRLTGRTVRTSLDSSGREGSIGDASQTTTSMDGRLTPDGRFAVFSTEMGGLVDDDPPGTSDVFVRDLHRGITTRESVDDDGDPSHQGGSFDGKLSDDGRYVAFTSNATGLVSDVNYTGCFRVSRCRNVFHRDRFTGRTRLLSVDKDGNTDSGVAQVSMSGDGAVVAWTSTAARMVAGDTNEASDVFVMDLRRRTVQRASVSSTGAQQEEPGVEEAQPQFGSFASVNHSLSVSADGRRVSFDSRAANLVPGDTNGRSDVFVHDLVTRRTSRLSVSSLGEEGTGDSYRPALSRDGGAACFESDAGNLASDDNSLVDVFCHDLGSV